MNYFRNLIAVAVLGTALFAGQALESAKLRTKNGGKQKNTCLKH